jgi:hypothetical protein
MAEERPDRDIPLVWVGLDELPVLFANQFLIQHWQDAFVVSVGQLVPPPVTGTPEEQAEEIDQISYVPVKPVARLGFTRERVRELIIFLEASLEQYDRKQDRPSGGDGA